MLIFLDIDGVMVPAKPWKAPALLQDGFPVFSSKATSALRQLVTEGSTVMLTTSHKSKYSIDAWKEMFRTRGIVIGDLGLLDNNVDHLSRRQEIENWFDLNTPDDNFIILDDDKSLNDLPIHLKKRLILTEPMVGLTCQQLEQAKLAERVLLA